MPSNSIRPVAGFQNMLLAMSMLCAFSQASFAAEPLLSVKQLMNGLITPATNTIWGAYELETDEEWKAVGNAALTVIAAANLMQEGGKGDGESENAAQAMWQQYTSQMVAAANNVLAAVAEKDEATLSEVGNNELYPPCESCHQEYQSR